MGSHTDKHTSAQTLLVPAVSEGAGLELEMSPIRESDGPVRCCYFAAGDQSFVVVVERMRVRTDILVSCSANSDAHKPQASRCGRSSTARFEEIVRKLSRTRAGPAGGVVARNFHKPIGQM